MNKIIFASVLAVATALIGSPSSASAGHNHHDDDDEVIAAIGGFVGGLIVGSAINTSANVPPPVGVAVSYDHGHSHRRHGHWDWTTVRVWVPGRWVYVDRGCDRPRRVWVAGHYDHRRERVWVAHRGNSRCDRGCR